LLNSSLKNSSLNEISDATSLLYKNGNIIGNTYVCSEPGSWYSILISEHLVSFFLTGDRWTFVSLLNADFKNSNLDKDSDVITNLGPSLFVAEGNSISLTALSTSFSVFAVFAELADRNVILKHSILKE
jgi:hypothetical protein